MIKVSFYVTEDMTVNEVHEVVQMAIDSRKRSLLPLTGEPTHRITIDDAMVLEISESFTTEQI